MNRVEQLYRELVDEASSTETLAEVVGEGFDGGEADRRIILKAVARVMARNEGSPPQA